MIFFENLYNNSDFDKNRLNEVADFIQEVLK